MGGITNLLKSGASNMMGQIKSYNASGYIQNALNQANVDLQLPDVGSKVSEATKDWHLDLDPSVVKLPANVDSYISPIAKKGLAGVKLPSEINGVPLPEMPDLSSVTSKVDEYLSMIGIDTEKLGIRSVSDILKEPDLSALKKVEYSQPVDLNNMPDLTTSMDGFDIDGIQSQIDELTSSVPSMDSIDISKYF